MGRQKAPSPSFSVPNSEPPDPDPSLVTTDNSLQSNLLQIDLQLHKDATNARFEDLQESMEFIKNQQAQLRAELLDELKQMRLGSKTVADLHTSLPLRIDSKPPSSSTLWSKPTTSVIDARFKDMHESLEFVKNQQANLRAELPDEFKQFRLGSKTVAGHDSSLPLLIDPIPSSSSTIRSRITTSATGESIIAAEEFSMGEAPTFFGDELQKGYPNGFDLKSKGSETSVVMGNITYVIGGACEESALSIGVHIFDQTSGEWINLTVLGTKPKSYKGHSAVLLSGDQILIVKSGSNSDDFAWFLEVDTQYVRQQKKILGTEVVAWSKGVRGSAEKPVVISGPSGVGKGTLISMLMKAYPSMFGFSVSHTTRAPRAMEKDGVHYHFIERSAIEKEIEDGKFLEFSSATGNPNPLSSASNLHYVHSIIHMNNTTSTVSGIHERVTVVADPFSVSNYHMDEPLVSLS